MQNECEAPVKTQKMLAQGATTKERFPAGNKECQELKVGQLEVDLFGAVIQKMTGCQKNAQRSVSSTRFCQVCAYFFFRGICIMQCNFDQKCLGLLKNLDRTKRSVKMTKILERDYTFFDLINYFSSLVFIEINIWLFNNFNLQKNFTFNFPCRCPFRLRCSTKTAHVLKT